MLDEITYTLALLETPGAGPVMTRRILGMADRAGAPLPALFDMTPAELTRLAARGDEDAPLIIGRCDDSRRRRAHELIGRIHRAGARALRVNDRDYPASLTAALEGAAPPLLFVFGDLDLLHAPGAAVVGARDVSEAGALLAAECAAAFANTGVSVISGGAKGVDAAAHSAAIASGGKTVVVAPQGLLTFPMNRRLRAAVDEGRAAIVSEFSPAAPWETHAAVTRNATIVALSRVVCVIEPKKFGGSIRAARLALAYGRRVLVYTRPQETHVRRALHQAGAAPLLGENGQFSAARLEEVWNMTDTRRARQQELF